jgi:hypothetical protein
MNYKSKIIELLGKIDNEKFLQYLYILCKEFLKDRVV